MTKNPLKNQPKPRPIPPPVPPHRKRETGKAKVPTSQRALQDALRKLFADGEIYAYAYEKGVWSTWDTQHDWDHTERNGRKRCDEYHALRALFGALFGVGDNTGDVGPIDWDRDRLARLVGVDVNDKPRRLNKAELVSRLQAIADELPPAALEVLAAA